MDKVTYKTPQENNEHFIVEWDEIGRMASCRCSGDADGMDWVKKGIPWGSIVCGEQLTAEVTRSYTAQGRLKERMEFRNETAHDIYAVGTRLGICVSLPDYYTDASYCMTNCCHAHIWCGGRSSYICAMKMGGGSVNLGMVLTEGSLQGYSVERNLEEQSNDRGTFLLHPEDVILHPGESYVLSWELFWFGNREEFSVVLGQYEDFISIEAENFLLPAEEPIRFRAKIGGAREEQPPVILRNGEAIPCKWEMGCAIVEDKVREPGEYRYEICWKGQRSKTTFLKYSSIDTLTKRRCQFLAEKQQCMDEKSHLYGAYLIYDNEEHRQYYSFTSDHNGGRERVGMAVLMARWLQENPDRELEESLDLYMDYLFRELYDEETGEVFNDANRNQEWKRLYNYPWVSVLFLEMFRLKKDRMFLTHLVRCLKAYYRDGGVRFYAIAIPMYDAVTLLREEGMTEEAKELLACFREHGEYIAGLGKNYPSHEVRYEQSIVAPAAIYMCELYRLTEEEKYLSAAKEQLEVLELFQGLQPDYHLHDVAIRHWDGYWFGKRRLYGDTFPHYWSALSGIAFYHAKFIPGLEAYGLRAQNILRGTLSMFGEDGSASCAMVYPMSVNGVEACFYDPWANDQDWGLYFILRYSPIEAL